MAVRPRTFGRCLRETRQSRGLSLRRFAAMMEVSPAYLSQVERDIVTSPPTAERVRRMAELLGASADEWLALAGRTPEDITEIIRSDPEGMPALLRAAQGLSAEERKKIAEQIKRRTRGGKQ